MLRLFTLVAFVVLSCTISAQSAKTYTTTENGTKLLEYGILKPSITARYTTRLEFNPDVVYQEMDGFGFALTYSSCYNLMHMQPLQRQSLLARTFATGMGMQANYIRLSLGCCDFSSRAYSYCESRNLNNFALQSDEYDYILPVLHEVLRINPNIKILASPWTCPTWMKVRDQQSRGSWTEWWGGHLNPDCYDSYAEYFVRYIRAMEAEGIPIYAVTVQNEPLNGVNVASLLMYWNEQADFLRHLAPAFHRAGITTKIYVFDHNFNYDNIDGQDDYPVKVYEALDRNMEGYDLIVGAAYHDYGGSSDELNDIHDKAPDKQLIFTEGSIGTWNNGRSLKDRLMWDVRSSMLNLIDRHCRAVIYWNFMLDDNRGPNLSGGSQTCFGACDISSQDYSTVTFNSQYYIVGQLSSVVKSGATHIGVQFTSQSNGLSAWAFRNPDNSYALVLVNDDSNQKTVSVKHEARKWYNVSVPARSITSLQISPDISYATNTARLGSHNLRQEYLGIHAAKASLKQEETLTAPFADASASWFFDPDYVRTEAEGGLTFVAPTDEYNIKADFYSHYLVFEPTTLQPLGTDGQGDIFLVGARGSVGKPYYTSGTDWHTEDALPLVKVADGIYRITLRIGQQLNPDFVNFKFYGGKDWTPEFLGSPGSDFRITSCDMNFLVSDGSGDIHDGNIYLRNGFRPEEGATYVFIVDISRGTSQAKLIVGRAETMTDDSLYIDQDQVVGVDGIKDEREDACFDLSGRAIAPRHIKPGLYITNGKKIIIHNN